MAGLAALTIVVEAAESSGSLITAEFAGELGREIGAVPGQVTSRRAAGGNRLLREGAAVIRSAQDALDEVLGVGSGGPEADALAAREGPGGGPREPVPPGTRRPRLDQRLDPQMQQVLDLVEGGEGVEAIARELGLAPGQARGALGSLELMGLVARDGLSGYVRLAVPPGAETPILGHDPDRRSGGAAA
jgi:DNA processing protein